MDKKFLISVDDVDLLVFLKEMFVDFWRRVEDFFKLFDFVVKLFGFEGMYIKYLFDVFGKNLFYLVI